jgi:ribokinase
MMFSAERGSSVGHVTVVGSYIVALVIDTERIPREGETVFGRNYHTTHGGKGSNMVCCAARLGTRARFLGKIGADEFGRSFLDLLAREGVDGSAVIVSDSLPTAVGFIITASSGSNLIVIEPGANATLTPDDVHRGQSIIQSAGAVVSPLEIPIDTALAGAEIAAAAGVPFILNPAPAQDLRALDLRAVSVLTPNETEARVCLGLAPDEPARIEDLAAAMLDLGPRNVIVTLGGDGVLWASGAGVLRVPALAVDVVDTVGAGDAFNAGLATGLSECRTMREAIALGVTAASLSTCRRETVDSYPRRPEVDGRLKEVLERF